MMVNFFSYKKYLIQLILLSLLLVCGITFYELIFLKGAVFICCMFFAGVMFISSFVNNFYVELK